MSTSSSDISNTERSPDEVGDGSIRIGEGVEVSLVVSMVLATNKSKEEGLELEGREVMGKLLVMTKTRPYGVSTVTGQ